jgi:mannitol-1-phosphate/altronate dehydrogenase
VSTRRVWTGVFTEDKGMSTVPRLSRDMLGLPAAAPIRLVHLGLGNFHRAHQAWYTANASDTSKWGIAAFTAAGLTLPKRSRRRTLCTR